MDLKQSEVTTILKEEISGFEGQMHKSNVGTVLQVGDGVVRVHGLDECMMNELIEFPGGIFGVALNLEEDNVGAVLLGDAAKVREGDTVKTTGRVISVPTGLKLVGRVVNALGQPIDGRGAIQLDESDYRSIEGRAPSVPERQAAAGSRKYPIAFMSGEVKNAFATAALHGSTATAGSLEHIRRQ